MQRRLALAVVVSFTLSLMSGILSPALAGYECSDIGVSVPEDQYNQSVMCGQTFAECVDWNNTRQQEYYDCIGRDGCWGIVRNGNLVGPGDCPADFETAWTPENRSIWYEGDMAYCQCVQTCEAARLENVDCNPYFKTCCDLIVDSEYGDYAVSDHPDVQFNDDEDSKPHIVLSETSFSVEANGVDSKSFSAQVVDKDGVQMDVPMWVEISGPNRIRPGTLDISKGLTGGSDTQVEATYTAPQISVSEKSDPMHQIVDLIYVFATIEGQQTYKVITAKLYTQGENARITIEKEGFKKKEISVPFNKGALTGTVYIEDEGDKYRVNDAKVTLVLPDEGSIEQTTQTDDGSFFFENLEKTGEDTVEITLELDTGPAELLEKGHKFYIVTIKLGRFNTLDYIDQFYKLLAEAEEDEVDEVLTGLRLSVNTLYMTYYYTWKVDESLKNFAEYFRNVIKDAASFMIGSIGLVESLYSSSVGDATSGLAKKLVGWGVSKGSDGVVKQLVSKTVQMLVDGIYTLFKQYPDLMQELRIILGGIENELVNRIVNAADEYAIEGLVTAYFNDVFLTYAYNQITETLDEHKIDLDNLPDDLSGNLRKAQQVFLENDEKHNYRNDLQYKWDVGTAFATMLIDIGKGTAKAIVLIKSGAALNNASRETLFKAIDGVADGFGKLKIFLSGNHVYEWLVLLITDVEDFESSITYLHTGHDVQSRADYDEEALAGFTTEPAEQVDLLSIAYAEVAPATVSSVLMNIASAIEDEDEDALEDALDELEEVWESDQDQLSSQYDEVLESLPSHPDLNEQGLELLSDTTDAQMDLALLDLELMALQFDQGDEMIGRFTDAATEYDSSYEQVHSDMSDYREQVEQDPGVEDGDKSEGDGSDINLLPISLLGLGILIGLGGLMLVIRQLKKKKFKAALIVLVVSFGIAGGLVAAGFIAKDANKAEGETGANLDTDIEVTDDADIEEDEDLWDVIDEDDIAEGYFNEAEGIEYTDDEYGFSITLPEEWEDYVLERYEEDGFREVGEWYFYLPTEDGEVFMFAITIYDLQEELEEFVGFEVIAEDDLYQYTWLGPDYAPDSLEDRVDELDQIKQSFTLE